MRNKLLRLIRQYDMIMPGDTVVCAVSGGADSVALLFAMYLLRDKLDIRLEAAHFNHHLRGEESDGDEAFVREFCGRYDIPLHVGSAEVRPGKKGLEAAARDILVADYINGTKNTMQGTAKPLVVPQLAGHDSAWYLLCASRPIRPLIWQQRKKPKFVSKTQETDDNVFMRKTFLYGADYRGNAGFGFWQMAYGGDGTAE